MQRKLGYTTTLVAAEPGRIRDALSPRRKVIILLSCCLSLLIVSMDATIVNGAIPSIRAELHASPSQLQ